MILLRALATDLCSDIYKLRKGTQADLYEKVDRKYEELRALIHSSSKHLDDLTKSLEPLFTLYNEEIYDGKTYMNAIVEDIAYHFLKEEKYSLSKLEALLRFAEKCAWMGAFQVPYGKLITVIKKWLREHKQYPEGLKNGLTTLFNAMVGRPMYGRGPFLKRIDEVLLLFSRGLDIISEECALYPHLKRHFDVHDASLLVWKKLWGEAVMATSFKMPEKVGKIIHDTEILASVEQLKIDSTFLLKIYHDQDWHKISKESETLLVAALWVIQALRFKALASNVMEIASKAATQAYGGIYSPRLLKVAVSTVVALGDNAILPQLLSLQSNLRQQSYRKMIQSELEGFAKTHGIPEEFVTEMLLSRQERSLPPKTLKAAQISLERWYLNEKALLYSLFQEIFLNSALWRSLVQGLIFVAVDGKEIQSFMISGPNLLDYTGKKISPSPESVVSLWHPILASEHEQTGYKVLIKSLNLKPLFKQADREFFTSKSYPNLDPPLPHHVVKQKVFRTLARLRGWDAPMISSMYFAGLPTLKLEKRKTEVILAMRPYGTIDGELITLEGIEVYSSEKLSDLVISEILRDIALFQAKAGVM